MSLQRNIENTPQQELSRLWENVMKLKAEERQTAEDKYQTALLLATVDKMCGVLTDFMKDTQGELRKMNENQLRLLDVQEQYRQSVRKDAAKVLNDNLNNIIGQQNKMFDKLLANSKNAVSEMETAVEKSAEKLNKATHASTITGLWYSLAPVAVIVQTVILMWQHFH